MRKVCMVLAVGGLLVVAAVCLNGCSNDKPATPSPVAPVTLPAPPPVNTTPGPTLGWQIVEDKEVGKAGFQIMLPPGFEVQQGEINEDRERVYSAPSVATGEHLRLDVSNENPNLLSLESWADSQEWIFEDWRKEFDIVTLGENTYLRSKKTCSAITVKGESVYGIKDSVGMELCSMSHEKLDLILSTLQISE